MLCFLLVPLYASTRMPSKGTCAKPLMNFVKQNKSSLLGERGSHPNTSSISETLEYLEYLHLTNLAARRCTLSTLSLLYFWYNNNNCLKSNIQCIEIRVQWTVHLGSSHMHGVWAPNSDTILHKRANQRKVSSLFKLFWAPLQIATQKRKLGVSLVCHGCNMS